MLLEAGQIDQGDLFYAAGLIGLSLFIGPLIWLAAMPNCGGCPHLALHSFVLLCDL